MLAIAPDQTTLSPKLPQAGLQLRRQPIQHLATGRSLHHRLRRTLGLGVDHLDPTTHRMRALGLMLGSPSRQANRRMHLLHRGLHRLLQTHAVTQHQQTFASLAPGLADGFHRLTRALLHAAGHAGHVKSPTYTLSEPYTVQLDGQSVNVIHFDLYRMSSPEEFLDAGFREDFNADTICIVEWPEKGDPVLPPPDLNVFLHVAGAGRDVELQALSDQGLSCLDRLDFPLPP
mgnify:CR=1 FL=1